MNPVRKQRLLVVLAVLIGLGIACGLMFYALRQNINLFYTPQQIASGEAPLDAQMRVGGLVEPGTVIRNPDTLDVTFGLTDGQGALHRALSGHPAGPVPRRAGHCGQWHAGEPNSL